MAYNQQAENGASNRKNDVRPGDWYCYQCGQLNYASRDKCFKGCPVMRPVQHGQGMYNQQNSIFGVGPPGVPQYDPGTGVSYLREVRERERDRGAWAGNQWGQQPMAPPGWGYQQVLPGAQAMNLPNGRRVGDWDCPKCNAHNYANRTECFKCNVKKPLSAGAKRPGDWYCPDCSAHNYTSREKCFRCKKPKPEGSEVTSWGGSRRPGDWDCPECKAHNYASREACFKCEVPKGPDVVVVPPNPEEPAQPQPEDPSYPPPQQQF